MAGETDYTAIFMIEDYDGGGEIRLECQKCEGGNPAAQLGKGRNPVTGKERSRAGLREMSDLEVEIEIELAVWLAKRRIDGSSGVARYKCVKTFVDARRVPIPNADPDTFTGYVGELDWGAFDINGGDNTSMLTITCGVDER